MMYSNEFNVSQSYRLALLKTVSYRTHGERLEGAQLNAYVSKEINSEPPKKFIIRAYQWQETGTAMSYDIASKRMWLSHGQGKNASVAVHVLQQTVPLMGSVLRCACANVERT